MRARHLLFAGSIMVLGIAAGELFNRALAQSFHDQIPPGTSFIPLDHPAIRYNDGPLDNAVERLNQRLESGKVKLPYREGDLGYLPGILELFGIKADSQTLVFSKTSVQAQRISPSNPRAIYFSDDVQVGYVRGGDAFEVVALDPKLGDIFYSFDAQKTGKPSFDRRDDCLQCHQGPATLGVPGIMVVSVHPDPSGQPASKLGEPVTDHRTPFNERWGGWYVEGTFGGQANLANAVSRDLRNPENLEPLEGKFNPSGYLSPMSDVVALMTLEHQTRMTNLLTRLNWEWRIAQPGKADPQFDADLESAVAYMLFVDEAKLQEPITGVSTFTKTFAERGPRDPAGRSLRDFDLHTRLFRYPLSYMIYSAAFDGLPEPVRSRLYQRLYDVLSGKDADPKFARLSAAERRAVMEILRDTKPGLPAYWKTSAAKQTAP